MPRVLFKPGQSGNPGGRPKSHVVAMARKHTQAAIDALVTALDNPRERVPAAVALLDRGWGRPSQPVEGDMLRETWVVRAPPEVETASDWFRRYAPRDALEHERDG